MLIDIGQISGLSYIRDAGDHIAVGALTRHIDVEKSRPSRSTSRCSRVLRATSATRRSAAAAPSADRSPTATRPATCRHARPRRHVRRTGPNGTREIAAADFHQDFLTRALEADELLTEIRVPTMHGAGWGFQKFNRRAQDWAIVGAAAWKRNGDSGIGLVNVGSSWSSSPASPARWPTVRPRPRPPSRQWLQPSHRRT